MILSTILLARLAHGVSWMGNTKLYENGNNYPARAFFLDPGQALTITTQTWPIAPNQQVRAVVTTDNWQTSQELQFSYDKQMGNNSQWYLILPQYGKNTTVNFYLRCDEYNNGTVYDNNGWQNFGFITRNAPNYDESPILQWFETPYTTIMQRLPEVAMAGYGAIYLPAPQKSAGGGIDVGYSPFDHFDLGDRVQKGSMRTKYGSTQELIELIRLAHRLGIKVYCDLVLNHMANRASAPINTYPGMIPEDFHIASSANTTNPEIDFNNAQDLSFNIFNYDLLGLADIAHEDGNATRSGAFNFPSYASMNGYDKPSFVRNATVPQLYPNNTPVAEDVREYLKRWVRWLATTVGFDGFRLDAVKHMPPTALGFAPDQPSWGGATFANGDILNYLQAYAPNSYVFGENFTSNSYAHREYLKTGMNLLDFNLFFAQNSLFNSNGYGNIGSTLGNAYGTDSYGMPYQNGGLGSLQGVTFVQSHDNGPPTANNLAYAWILTRPGRPKVYYDGNNIQPGNWANFPRPGREDALGNASDTVPKVASFRPRARGYIVNRFTQTDDNDTRRYYIYERQVNGQGTVLVGLNLRGDLQPVSQSVQTSFAAGTVLEDLSGQQPNLTVAGNGTATVTIPANSSPTVSNNATGFVVYAPLAPKAVAGVPTVAMTNTSTSTDRPTEFPTLTYTPPKGTYGSTKTYSATTVNSDRAAMLVNTDALGNTAYVKFNQGISVAGRTPQSNTSEQLTDGYIMMEPLGNGRFRLQNIETSVFPEGLNIAKVRVFRNYSGPAVFTDFNYFFFVSRPAVVDGLLSGSAITTQTRTATSNSNRCDSLYLSNDETYLYVGVAGRVDPSESFTNGMMVWLDTDASAGTGATSPSAIKDDSGPAARLISQRKGNFPSGFGADLGIGMLRNSILNSAPESPFGGGLVSPPPIGAFAGAFRINTATPAVMTPLTCQVAYQQRTNKTDSAKGLEVAIKLTDVFPSGIGSTTQINAIAGLGTTGESGTTLVSSDANRATLGGRPAPAPYMTNQYLPTQPSVISDPGTGSPNLTLAAPFIISQATLVSGASYTISTTAPNYSPRTGKFTVGLTITATAPIAGPINFAIKPGTGITLLNATSQSIKDTWQGIRLTSGSLSPGQKISIQLSFSGNAANYSPVTAVFRGAGIY